MEEKKKKLRLDMALQEQGFFDSRTRAQASIMAGEVLVNGQVEYAADRKMKPEDAISIKEKSCPYVSRGGIKLEHALKEFNIGVKNKICVDIGVATGGFSHCFLIKGANRVYGVDVGKGQLADEVRRLPNFIFRPETNARFLEPNMFEEKFDVAAVDVSFISLKLIMGPLMSCMAKDSDIVFLIKPQFELSAKEVPGGIVKTEENRQTAIKTLRDFFEENLKTKYHAEEKALIPSPITGTHGNTEYLWHIKLNGK